MKKNLGLYNGELSHLLLYIFKNYNKINNDYLIKRLNIIIEAADKSIGFSYSSGFSGIGSFISLFSSLKIINIDVEETLASIDDYLFDMVYYHPFYYLSLENGLLGIGNYFLKRLNNENVEEKRKLKIQMILLVIQDIVSAFINVDGYHYPFAQKKQLTQNEIFDTKLFLKQMFNAKISTSITAMILDYTNINMNVCDVDVIYKLKESLINQDEDRIRFYISELGNSGSPLLKKQAIITTKKMYDLWRIY